MKSITHSDECRGLLLPTLIDGATRQWCSGCGQIVGRDCSCGASFRNEDEAHCSACHSHFPTDADFFSHQDESGSCRAFERANTPSDQRKWSRKSARRTPSAAFVETHHSGAEKPAQKMCRKGLHPWVPSNIYVQPGTRGKKAECRKCKQAAARRRRNG